MRPLELRLRNFRSYFGDEYTFDFRERRLVGVVGPIGAGKSTILDAIAFGLYGRTPRINRGTKSLIHQRADGATVLFRFAIDDEIWEVVRSIRRKGQSQHALYRYEVDEPDAVAVEKVTQEAEVNARIETMLGFDYDAFGRSVLLAQGQFAEFLTARPAERDKVLKGVFGHDRIDAMREVAKQKVSNQTHEIDKLGIRLEGVEAAVARMAQRMGELVEMEERAGRLEKAEPQMLELSVAATEAAERLKVATARVDELNRMASRMPEAESSSVLVERAIEARKKRSELAEHHESVHAAMAAAEHAIKSDEYAERVSKVGKAGELLVRVEAQRNAVVQATQQVEAGRARLDKATQDGAAAASQLEAAEVRAESAGQALSSAKAAAEQAEADLHEARHADMAATLRTALVAGQPCPVCEQEVDPVPKGSDPVAVAAAEEALDESRGLRDAADRDNLAASRNFEAAKAVGETGTRRGEELTKELAELDTQLADTAEREADILSEIAEMIGEGDPEELVAAERQRLDELSAGVEAARRRVDDARRELDAAIAGEQEADRALGDLRTQLSALATQLDASADVPQDDPKALSDALVALRDGWVQRTTDLTETQTSATADATTAAQRRAELLVELEVDGEFSTVLAEARAKLEVLRAGIAEDEKLIAGAEDLVTERDQIQAELKAFERLQTDLTDAKFIRFLLDEERTLLAELGSEHFLRLSSGRYRFTEDGDFHVVDLTAADTVRRPDSLSGGETFLASLGLALGLAEMVGRTGGRLDAFFLDEGFGTLDPEHLDLAMEGIEALVADRPNRLVVVVSHVPELRHRVEDLIELDRHPVTGDSILVAGATRD